MFCLHVCVCTTCVPGAQGGPKGVSDPLKLEIQMSVAAVWVLGTQILYRRNKRSHALSHLSRLTVCIFSGPIFPSAPDVCLSVPDICLLCSGQDYQSTSSVQTHKILHSVVSNFKKKKITFSALPQHLLWHRTIHRRWCSPSVCPPCLHPDFC